MYICKMSEAPVHGQRLQSTFLLLSQTPRIQEEKRLILVVVSRIQYNVKFTKENPPPYQIGTKPIVYSLNIGWN